MKGVFFFNSNESPLPLTITFLRDFPAFLPSEEVNYG
jgi:hypothetical protein